MEVAGNEDDPVAEVLVLVLVGVDLDVNDVDVEAEGPVLAKASESENYFNAASTPFSFVCRLGDDGRSCRLPSSPQPFSFLKPWLVASSSS